MISVSKHNSLATLDYLANTTEGQYLERKGIEEAGLKPTKLANEIIGMLNADGGIIALGISDYGEVQDLNKLDTKILRQYRKVLHDFVTPPAYAILEEVTLDSGQLIFLYHIEQDYERLFKRSDNDDVYLRVSDDNKGPLTTEEIDKLQYDKTIRSFEDQKRTDFDPDDLQHVVIDLYREQINFKGTNEELLLKRNLAVKDKEGEITYKNSAILLFSDDPEKYIPSSSIRYIRYKGNEALAGDEYNVTKDERFYGNVPTLINSLREFIYASLDDYFFLDITTGKFLSVSEYPEGAWLEGMVNALFHRSYNLQGNSIYIKHYDNRLEISNSGPLPAQVTIENIRHERFSRNPRIGRVLSEMGYTRELNEGVNRIYSAMERSMLAQPVYSDRSDIVTLTLKNKISDNDKTIANHVMQQIESRWGDFNDTERRIIGHLFAQHKATIDEFSSSIGVTGQAVRTYLNRFMKADLIERHSDKLRDKKALYTFKKNT